ncbi:MAG TPA: hypothetical protein VHF01_19325 [Candidatus Acidoferrum sp.]|nr:hypothetical protein [Candidatus Acidoferrum sp.]
MLPGGSNQLQRKRARQCRLRCGLKNQNSTSVKRRKKPRSTTTQPGYWAAKAALTCFGSCARDGRTRVFKALDELRADLVNDLGGPDAITKQQNVILSLALRTHLLLESLDAFIFTMDSPVNKRRRSVYPVVAERQRLADSLAKYMAMLGLERRQKPIKSLQEHLRDMEAAKAAETQEEQS